MKNFLTLMLISILLVSCQAFSGEQKRTTTWADARWIAYEVLPDSMKVVPGVHGKGNGLG